MEKLISELLRLYLTPQDGLRERLAAHLLGQDAVAVQAANGMTRVLVIPFDMQNDGTDAHWAALCELASTLQVQFGFPAPAVSVSGAVGYRLWLSLAAPVPVADVQQFLERLHGAHGFGLKPGPGAAASPHAMPPCLNAASGKWAAFINPGMGASFADEPGLEVAPPLAAQAAFLDGLESISLAQFGQALHALEPVSESIAPEARPAASAPAEGLLLRDATLEDIIAHLHAKNIEPTFRHLIPRTA
ncbi:hypothetical protein [Massilia niabensis]|uniref:Uncharacterized protein n=1 Tax=Massilia niabensis TaxID=544910 RepID=A0ABW0LB53_9BURK